MAVRRSPTLPGGLSIDAYDSLVSSALDAPPDVPAELVVWHARLEPTPVRVAVVEACRHVEHACAPDVHTCDQCGATLGEGVTARAD